MHSLNITLFHAINNLAGHVGWLDRSVVFLTSWGAYVVCALCVLYTVLWIPLRSPVGLRRLGALGHSVLIAFSLALTWLVVVVVKVVAAHPRPFETLHGIHQLVSISTATSFPSNHAALVVAMATIVHFHHQRLGRLLFLFAFLVALSRLYVGVHYPIDIVVGAAIGYAIPTFLHKIFFQDVKHSDE